MDHLDTLIPLLERIRADMTAQQVENVADSLLRLRNGIVVEATVQRARAATPEVTPVPFRDFHARESER